MYQQNGQCKMNGGVYARGSKGLPFKLMTSLIFSSLDGRYQRLVTVQRQREIGRKMRYAGG